MDVSRAVDQRASIRSFTDTPVPDELIRELLTKASRAPSGGNVQPWKVTVVNGAAMTSLLEFLDGRAMDEPEYEVYPAGLWEPHRTARFELGEQMYDTMGIARDDKAARFAHLARNYTFFGAPAAFFCHVDRRMGLPQWSDLGMFLQTFMLLAVEAGLDTCPQEAWANRAASVDEFLGVEEADMLFCGMAIGHRDDDAPVNALRSERLPLDAWARWAT